jgi:hypothetical protein
MKNNIVHICFWDKCQMEVVGITETTIIYECPVCHYIFCEDTNTENHDGGNV